MNIYITFLEENGRKIHTMKYMERIESNDK